MKAAKFRFLGDKSGVFLGGEKLSWEEFAEQVKTTPSKDLILTCYSERILNYTRDAVTFGNNPIDAVIGANLASYILTGETKPLKLAVDRVVRIMSGSENPILLYLSSVEGAYWIAVLCATILFILLAYYTSLESTLIQKTVEALEYGGKVAAIYNALITLEYLSRGWIDLDTAISNIIGVFCDILSAYISAIKSLSFWDQIILWALVGSAIWQIIMSGTSVLWAKIAAGIVSLVAVGAGFYSDWVDSNWWVG